MKTKRLEAFTVLVLFIEDCSETKVYVRKVYVYVYMNLFENVFLFFKWLTCLTAVKISFDYISCLVFVFRAWQILLKYNFLFL